VTSPGQAVLLGNPAANQGRAAKLIEPVADRLRADGLDVTVIVGSSPSESAELTAKAVADGACAVIALGGDGIVHLAAQAVCGTVVPLAVIPAGTGNDFADALGVPADPMQAADAAARALQEGRTRAVDAVRCGERWWVNVLGSGFDSAVNEHANGMRWPKGRRKYDLAILAVLRQFRPIPYRLELDGEVWETEAMLVALGNGVSYGGGLRITPDAVLDDGLLDVTVVGAVSKLELLKVFPRVKKGGHIGHPAVTVKRAREVRLSAPGQVGYADGERLGELPITATVVPGALTVLDV
jgi:diacylglycerol kinase (ATP)